MSGVLKKILVGIGVIFVMSIITIFFYAAFLAGKESKENTQEEMIKATIEEVEVPNKKETEEKEILDTILPEAEEEPVEEKEFDPFEFPNYIMEGDTYTGLYTEKLYMNAFKDINTRNIDFNIFQFDENDELIPEACIGGELILKQEDEDGNATYTFESGNDKLTVGYVADTDTYFVQSQNADGYQIEEDFVKLDYETEESSDSDSIIFLDNETDIMNFFRDPANVGKRFEVGVPFAVHSFCDYRQGLGNDIHNSYYYITFLSTDTGASFSACLYGWSDQSKFFDGEEIYVQGIFESNQSLNADFDIVAEYCY